VQAWSSSPSCAFEGVGIKPDVEIMPTIEDLKRGKDTVLEGARLLLAED
jgi:hypothetical protein